MSLRSLSLACLLAGVALAGPAAASDPVLIIESPSGALELGLDDLRAMPTLTLQTTTIWTEGVIEFTGVPLSALLDRADAAGQGVNAVALNDYAVAIPEDGIGPYYPIVAYLMDGQPFPAREKGPLWIIYPYDSDPVFRSDEVYARSVWQLARLIVAP